MKLPFNRIITSLLLVGIIFNSGHAFSQEENPEEASKQDAKIALTFKRNTDSKASVEVKVSHKIEKEVIKGANVEVLIYLNEEDPANLIGKQKTNYEGIAIIPMNELFYSLADTASEYNFVMVMPETDVYSAGEESLTIANSKLDIEVYEEDSVRYIKAHLQNRVDGTYMPMAEVSLSFAVKRSFSNLPFGGDYTTTDEEGFVIVEFPTDIMGDENGDVEIIVSYKEDESYGIIEKRVTKNWGIPLVIDNSELQQKLWSSRSNAPNGLVAMVTLLLVGVWVILFYLMLNLLKIKKLGKNK